MQKSAQTNLAPADGAATLKSLHELGYTPIPIVPHDQFFLTPDGEKRPGGKAPGRFNPSTQTWHGLPGWQRFFNTPIPAQTLNKWQSWENAGAGIVTGNIIAVDIDTTHPNLAKAAIQAAEQTLGKTDFIRLGRAPKTILVYRVEQPITKLISASYDLEEHKQQRIEILGKGQQFVAFGTHPDTKKPYHWPVKSLLDAKANQLPLTTLEKLKEFIATFEFIAGDIFNAECKAPSHTDTNQTSSKPLADQMGQICEAAAALSPHLAEDYHSWVRVGMAIKGALPDDNALGFELFDEFSAKCELKYDPIQTAHKWDTFSPGRIGAGTLYRLAKESGWLPALPPAEEEFSPVTIEEKLPAPVNRAALFYKKPSEISPNLNHVALIEDLLDQGAMSVLYGESNTGKTFVAMDIAFHVATGKNWDDRRVTQGAVVYVAAEGGKTAENRVEALKRTHQLSDFPFYLVPCSVDLRHPNADTKPLAELIRKVQTKENQTVKLIVIDTLSRALAGGNENDSAELGALVRNFDYIRASCNSHLMVVHHSGKDKAKGARGHSLLRAATDTELEVADRTITATKQRDMEMGKPVGFELKTVELGRNAYGKTITSCVIRLVDAGARADFAAKQLTPQEALLLQAFNDATAGADPVTSGCYSLATAVWLRHCVEFDIRRIPGCPPWPADQKAARNAFNWFASRLESRGFVRKIRKGMWALCEMKLQKDAESGAVDNYPDSASYAEDAE